jgi:uncharacterized protein with beta-barrel porin domain
MMPFSRKRPFQQNPAADRSSGTARRERRAASAISAAALRTGVRAGAHLLVLAAFGFASPAQAEVYLLPAYGDGFDIDPRYTSIQIGNNTPGTMPFTLNADFQDFGFKMWQKVVVGDSTMPAPIDLIFKGYNIGQAFATGSSTPGAVTLRIGSMDITQTNVELENLRLVFGATDSTLNLNNGSLKFAAVGSRNKLAYDGKGRLTINALSGNNAIERAPGSVIYAPATITVAPGATLALRDFRGPFDDPDYHLHFRGKGTSIDVNGGLLSLERTRLFVDNGTAKFRNGAELFVTGSEWAGGGFDFLSFSDSRLTMDQVTELKARNLSFANSVATLESIASLTASSALFSGDSQIDGPSPAGGITRPSQVTIGAMTMGFGATLGVTGVDEFNVTNLQVWGGGTLGLVNSTMFARNIELGVSGTGAGGSLEIGENATLFLRAATPDNSVFKSALKPVSAGSNLVILPKGQLVIGKGSRLVLDDSQMDVTNNGTVSVRGALQGNGSLMGAGALSIRSGGIVAPSLGTGYGSIHVENTMYLDQGARLQFNIAASGALPVDPLVTYGAGPVIFTGSPVIEVQGMGPLSASALDGQSIGIIAAEVPGVAGTITTSGFTPTVTPINMPALLAYSVGDTNTNGRPDVTLFMDQLPVTALMQNPALTSKNRQGAANLLVTAAGGNATIFNTLNTVTNEQLMGTPGQNSGGYLDQIYPEPVSSFITVNLEAAANMRNMIFMRAMDTDPLGKRVWVDASGSQGSITGENGLGSFDYDLSSLTFGKDFGEALGGAWGGFLSFGQMSMNEHDNASQDLSATSYSAGLYGYWQHSGWEHRVVLGYTYGDNSSTRDYSFNGFSETFDGDYSSQALQAAVRASFDWINMNGYELRPEIGGSITQYRQGAFSETGGDVFGLDFDEAYADTYIIHVGLNGRLPPISNAAPVRPIGFVRYEYDFASNDDHSVDAALQVNPGTYDSFIGQGRGPSTLTAGLGIASEGLGPLQIEGGIAYADHTNGSEWGAGLQLRYVW